MSRFQFLLYAFGILASILVSTTQARSAKRLEGEGIIGGDEVKDENFSYQVSLYADGSNICGGSILTERFILTAAHCVVDETNGKFFNDPVKVIAGTNNLKSSSRVVADVIMVYVPTMYDLPTKKKFASADIAILKLRKDLGIAKNSKLSKVKIGGIGKNYDGVEAMASGFGYNSVDLVVDAETGKKSEKNGKSSNKMRFGVATVLKNRDCQKQFTKVIGDQHMCASLAQRDKNKSEGLCGGDSGGPLVYNGVQIGVVSGSPVGCREDLKPAIYTRVSAYLDFVKKVTDGTIDKTIRTHLLAIGDL